MDVLLKLRTATAAAAGVLAAALMFAGALAQTPDPLPAGEADPIAGLLETPQAPADGAPPTDLQDDAEALPPPPDGVAAPPMWRLSDADSEIWLLGTFHVLPPGLDWRTDALVRAADLAETIWFELEVGAEGMSETASAILNGDGLLPAGTTLSAQLGAEDGARLQGVAAELGLPMAQLDRMRPWRAFLALSMAMIEAQGFETGSGVETVLLAEARARGRGLEYFETIAEQLGYFSALAPETETRLLTTLLRDWDRQSEEFGALFDAWRAGDVRTIDSEMNAALRSEVPEAYETLIVRRNRAWTDEIAKAMAGSGRALIAVGAAHLVGEDSVPAMLEARGFAVERYGEDAPGP